MCRDAARPAAALLVAALLAPVFGAGAVLADDLRDMAADSTGLADNPATPGPDLYAPRVWGTDIPDMPSLLVLDAPEEAALVQAPLPGAETVEPVRPFAVRAPSTRPVSVRGPPERA
jgi:hypothetical protein